MMIISPMKFLFSIVFRLVSKLIPIQGVSSMRHVVVEIGWRFYQAFLNQTRALFHTWSIIELVSFSVCAATQLSYTHGYINPSLSRYTLVAHTTMMSEVNTITPYTYQWLLTHVPSILLNFTLPKLYYQSKLCLVLHPWGCHLTRLRCMILTVLLPNFEFIYVHQRTEYS